MNTGNLLSACMIVKNEEKNLERCLKSIKKLVDEIVVVDTGSTDGTVKIAKHFGARVYHHAWQNDFSLHRNQAISYARGRWVMIIDADEEMFLSDGATFSQTRDFLNRVEAKFPAVALTFHDIQKGSDVLQFTSTRIFRRGLVEYQGIVHNQPVLKISGDAVFWAGIYLKHYGYDLAPEQKAAKFKRTHELLMKQVEEGQVNEALPYFFLCQLHADNGDPKEAVVWAEKYWEHKNEIPKEHFCESIFFTTTKQYMKIGDQKKAYEWLERGISYLPGDLDMALSALEYGVWVKNNDLKVQASKDFIGIYKQYQEKPLMKGNRFVYAMRPEVLAYALFHLTVSQMSEGTQAMKELLKLLSTLNPTYRQGMVQDLEQALSNSAFPIRFQKEEAPGKSPEKTPEDFVSATLP